MSEIIPNAAISVTVAQIVAPPNFQIDIHVEAPSMPVPNQEFDITLTPSGIVDSRYPNGIPTGAVTLTWATVPSFQNEPQGTPLTENLSSYLTVSGGTPTYAIVGTLPPGWSLNSSTGVLSYSGTGIGSATVQIKATIGSTSATSNPFVLQTFNPIMSDTAAPTQVTGLTVTVNGSNQNVLAWDAASDPVIPNHTTSGLKQYVINRDGSFLANVSSAVGLAIAWAYADTGAVGAAGSATQATNGTDWTISAAGTDIYALPNAFGGITASVNSTNGAVTLIGKLASFTASLTNAKTGLMFRQSSAASSPYVFLGYQVENNGAQGGINLISVATATSSPVQTLIAAPNVPSVSAPLWFKLVWIPASNGFTGYYSTDGENWVLVATVTVPMPSAILAEMVVCSFASGTRVTAGWQQVNLQQLAAPTYTDTSATGTHTYTVASEDIALNTSTATSVTSSGSSGSQTLLGLLKNTTGCFSGQTDNIFDQSNNPLSAYSATAFNGSNIVAATTITGTSLQPAVQNSFCLLGITSGGGAFVGNNMGSSNTGNGFYWPIVQARDAAGIINFIVILFPNPAIGHLASNNPWDLTVNGIPAVLDPASAVYQQLQSWATATANLHKTLTRGHLIAFPGELNNNTTGDLKNGDNWMGPAVSGTSSANVQQLFGNVTGWFTAAGYTKFVNVFTVNSGPKSVAYNWGFNPAIIDVIAYDNQPATYIDNSVVSSFIAPSGLPSIYGSYVPILGTTGDDGPDTAPEFAVDMGASVLQYCINAFSNRFKACVEWGQNVALRVQNNPAGFMSANGMIPLSGLTGGCPTLGGGKAGG